MLTLAIDTASVYCSVALVYHKSPLVRISERIGRGHAEKLIGQIIHATHQANVALEQVNRIAVNVGPGSFTGVRVGIATARALALALEIPVIGVSSLEALAAQISIKNTTPAITVALEAGRGMFYHQNFSHDLTPLSEPCLKTLDRIIESLPPKTILTGSAASIIALHLKNQNTINSKTVIDQIPCEAADVLVYAHLAANRQPRFPPRPLYLRDADARKHINFALPRKND